MDAWHQDVRATIYHGDCLEVLRALPDASVDAVVTDPPYGINFMGKAWDGAAIAQAAVSGVDHTKTRERSASMHAGSYDLSATGNRAFQAWATEWAAECLRVLKPGGHLLAFGGTRTWHRLACAIEDAGFEVRDSIAWMYGSGFPKSLDVSKAIDKAAGAEREVVGSKIGLPGYSLAPSKGTGDLRFGGFGGDGDPEREAQITAPATDAAREWSGWGTALKPAHEPIVVARKPLVGTVAANVLEHGTGALNIDGARVGYESGEDKKKMAAGVDAIRERGGVMHNSWKNSSDLSGANPAHENGRWPANVITDGSIDAEWVRYFYSAKASKAERNAGLNAANTHPTVKPLALMRYLVRLVTPPGGTVLEPFAGSGTTLAAAILEGFDAIGCELTADYLPIIEGRIAWAEEQMKPDPESLFNQ